MRDQERKLSRIGQGVAEAKAILGGDSGVERKLVPIGKRVTSFESEAAVASLSGEMLNLVLHANCETRRQSHFDLLPEKMSRQALAEDVAFVSGFEFKAERRKHIRLCERRDATMR